MVKGLKRTVSQVAKSLSPSSARQAGLRRRRNRPGLRQRRRLARRTSLYVSRGPRGILAGYGSPLQATYAARSTPDGCIVSGFDLVTSYPLGEYISYYMPANPLWWQGTRIAAQARSYQNYRPLRFVIHYRPQVGSTSENSLFIGTLWQGNSINVVDSIEPSLVTSPGGVYLPAWNDVMTEVKLGRHLPQQMFPVNDRHFTTVPFTVVSRSSPGGPSSKSAPMPGRIFIEYVYELRNAIGGQAILKEPKVIVIRFGDRGDGVSVACLDQIFSTTTAARTMYGTYRGRVMDVSDSSLLEPFGINSEFSVNFASYINHGDQFVVSTPVLQQFDFDGNWNPTGLPSLETYTDLDTLPYIRVFCTDYPTASAYAPSEEE